MKIKEWITGNTRFKTDDHEFIIDLSYIRRIFLLFIIAYAAFGITDLVYFPDTWRLLFIIRFGIVIPIFIFVMIMSFTKKFRTYYQLYGSFSFFVGGIGVAFMLIINPDNIIYYGGLFMIYFSGYLLISLKFRYAAWTGLAILLFHFIGYMVTHDVYADTFLYGSIFFIGANIIGMVGCYNLDAYKKNRIIYEKEIEKANQALKLQYEEKVNQYNLLVESMQKNEFLSAKNEELDRLTQKLHESEEHHKLVLNSTSSGIYAMNDEGICTFINENALKMLGYDHQDEVLGKNVHQILHHSYEDGAPYDEEDCFLNTSISSSFEVNKENIIWRKDGTSFPVFYSSMPQFKHDVTVGAVVTFSDISVLKAQALMKKISEEKYQLLFQTMAQGVVYQNPDGVITSCNPKAEEILGLSLDQMQGKISMDPRWRMMDEQGQIVSGEDHPSMMAIKTKQTVGPEIRGIYRPEKDDYVWLVINAIPLFEENQEDPYLVYATFEDITEKMLNDRKIKHLRDMLEYIIKHSSQGVAVHDKDMNYIYVSDAYCDMYQVNQDIIGKNHYEVFPDLPEKWRKVHQRVLKGETLHDDRDTYPREDGRIDYTRWSCQPWYDENHDIAGIIIYTEIINSLIEKEIEIQESHQRLQHIMDHLPIGIAINSVDPEVNFEYMNDNFPAFYHTTREALEKNDAFFDVVYEDPSFRADIKEKVMQGIASNEREHMKWEDVPITKNGEIVKYISAYAIPLPNSSHIISTVLDVTERKMKENMIMHTSRHDYLTNLPNRRYFEEMIQLLNRKEYYPLAIIMLDLDGLKIINDAFGHDQGDLALIKVSDILKQNIKPHDFIARIGGDEFILLCPKMDADSVEDMKYKIFNEVSKAQGKDFMFSLSFGYAIKTNESKDIEEILKDAEDSMYSNKVLHGQSARNESVMSILSALKDKYDEERVHSDKVSQYCLEMGKSLKLDDDHLKELELAGLMHDIGKITIPDSILDKPGKLTEEEWVVMKTHTINGYNILKSADKYSRLAEYALTHHERWDGKGYPNGLKGTDIPLFSRIISICDAYEAMTADRPYRKALNHNIAIEELNRCAGAQFDEKLVQIFIHDVIKQNK